jgi:HTH-type transcriptional regulator/antitoxin HigA
MIHQLMDQGDRSTAEDDLLGTLVLLAEAYDTEKFEPIIKVSVDQLLRHLIDARGISAATLARDTGIPKSTVSQMLSGTRGVSRMNIQRLANYFSISPQVLLDAPLRDKTTSR